MLIIRNVYLSYYIVNNLEYESVVELCSEIRETLEELVKKWGSTLSKQHVFIPSDVPEYHDGIDNVIQSIDAIRCEFFIYKKSAGKHVLTFTLNI